MAEKEVKTIRMPKPEADDIEEMANERDMTEADMYRQLIRTGLDAERDELDRRFGLSDRAGLSVQAATFVLVLLNIVLVWVMNGGIA